MARTKKTKAILEQQKEEDDIATRESAEEEHEIDESNAAERGGEDVENEEADDQSVGEAEQDAEEEEAEEEGTEEEAAEEGEATEEEAEDGNDGEDVSASETSSSSRKSARKRSVSEVTDDLHFVPTMKKLHKSWKAFDTYLERYERRTTTVVVVSETVNVALRNLRLRNQTRYANTSDDEIPLVPADMDPYQRTYICTHGWKQRSRSTGRRPVQRVHYTGCPFRFLAQVYERKNGKWGVEVKREYYGHNHQVSEEIYRSYPGIRQVPSGSPIMNDVELMVSSGSKPSRIYDYIRENSPHRVNMRDVHNLVTRIRHSGDEFSDEDLVAELLVDFNLDAAGNVATVNENARGQTAVISISSQHMRKLYRRFPELLLVDCTHKTNRYNYQLCTFMVMDQFGNGQPVQHSVIERSADWHMVKTIEHFQTVNDWEQTKVIVVDKDMNEVQVLRRMFPDSRVLLCHFHVIKWLAKVVRDDKKYGSYPSEVLKQMDHCVSNMVYSKSEEELQDHSDQFKTLACRDDRDVLWTYFQDNWTACKEMWVTAFRMHLPHFRNNTNNRLESFFGKLKADIDSSYSMKDCLKTILKFQRRKEDDYNARTLMPGSLRNSNYGEEMNQVLGMTTEWVAGIFFEEYQFATDPDSMQDYTFNEADNVVKVRRADREHQVDKTTWLCDCEFSVTMKLPCRHVLLFRKHAGGYLTVPYSSIPSRWYRTAALDVVLPDIDVPIRVISTSEEAKRKKQMTEKDKYKQAQNVFARITTELTDLTEDKFLAAIDNLEGWWSNLRRGDVAVPPSAANDHEDEEGQNQLPPTQTTARTEADPDQEEKDSQIHGAGITGGAIPAASAVKPFNPRAPKSGRPRKKRAEADAKRHAEKKTYNNGSKLRKELREKDILDVVQLVQASKPALKEIASFLDTFETRFRGYEKKEITVKTFAPPAQIMPFRLPETLVRSALTELRNLHRDQVVDLSIPDDGTHIWRVVCIEGAGAFSEQKLLAMEYLWNLTKTCKNGLKCFSWLMSDVDDRFEGEGAIEVANEMLGSCPHDKLVGFGFDVEWEHLYCARTESWYNDTFINAFLTTLATKYRNNTTLFLPPLSISAPRKGRRVPVTTLSMLSGGDEDFVFMPINLNHSHWACLLVDRANKNVVCYDSVDKRSHHNLLMELAAELVSKSLTDFNTPYAIHSPIQKDSDSCGLFVCLFFWKRLHKDAGNDYTQEGILHRRWDILHAIVAFNTENKNNSEVDLQ